LVQESERERAAAMGKLARLVDGIKEKLAGGGKAGKAVCYDKVDKTESMRVEIRSRRARQLIDKNLAVADDIAGCRPRAGAGGGKKKNKKKRFFGF
jgi:hypothetical protein